MPSFGMLFDTHCHLDAENFPGGAADVIGRAQAAGVGFFTCIGVGSLGALREAVALAEAHPNVFATAGVHPHDAKTFDAAYESELETLLARERVVALGEVGLDYHYDHSPRDLQKAVFRRSVALARTSRKPLVVHTRAAAADTLAILEEESARDVGGIIHCFSEDRRFAGRALDLGFYLSFSGILTFKNAHSVHEAARAAPADRILVETDSPYLAPVPLRGKRCEPAFVVHTARRLAELRGTTFEQMADVTTANAARAFGVRLPPGRAGGA